MFILYKFVGYYVLCTFISACLKMFKFLNFLKFRWLAHISLNIQSPGVFWARAEPLKIYGYLFML